MKKTRKGKEGFTLVEVIAVLVILGILAAVAIPKYIDLQQNAEIRALQAGVAELNGREALTWGNIKLSTAGYVDDATVYAAVDKDLGADYTLSGASEAGGLLTFKSQNTNLTRAASLTTQPGRWD